MKAAMWAPRWWLERISSRRTAVPIEEKLYWRRCSEPHVLSRRVYPWPAWWKLGKLSGGEVRAHHEQHKRAVVNPGPAAITRPLQSMVE
jgi:hypothetical protein